MNNLKYAAAIAIAAIALPAQAAPLFTGGPTGPLETPNVFGFTAASGATNGALSFTIDGFSSLDGVNFYEDDFSLSLNGTTVLQLSYDLGGGGANTIFTNSVGATVSDRYLVDGHWAIDVAVASLSLLVGNNSFLFSYDSPLGDALGAPGGHAGPQGLGDEAWGLSNISLTGQAVAAVPEPASWALMIGGFALIGATMRRRQMAVSFA